MQQHPNFLEGSSHLKKKKEKIFLFFGPSWDDNIRNMVAIFYWFNSFCIIPDYSRHYTSRRQNTENVLQLHLDDTHNNVLNNLYCFFTLFMISLTFYLLYWALIFSGWYLVGCLHLLVAFTSKTITFSWFLKWTLQMQRESDKWTIGLK